jgi:hypothetical protein
MNKMNVLYKDTIIHICRNLRDYDKYNFLSITNTFHKLKQHVFFNEAIHLNDIINSPYFDRCTNVVIYDVPINFPQYVTHLQINSLKNAHIDIPSSVTHLTLTGWCHTDILDCITPLNHITHLSLKYQYKTFTKECIPKNVVCIGFSDVLFRKNISECIPENVMHLIFDHGYEINNMMYYGNHVNWDDIPPYIKSVTIRRTTLIR